LVYNALLVSTNLIESKDLLKKRTPDDQFSFLSLMVLGTCQKLAGGGGGGNRGRGTTFLELHKMEGERKKGN